MPTWKDIQQLVKRLRREELIFLVVIVMVVGGLALLVTNKSEGGVSPVGLAVLVGGIAILALGGLWMHYRQVERDKQRESAVSKQHEELKSQITQLSGQLKDLSTPTVSIITKFDYPALIKAWNDAGEGCLCFYNIELQSFLDDTDIQRTWGQIAELTNIKSIEVLLPQEKMRRWEQIVKNQQHKFFANAANRKFNVSVPKEGENAPHLIGFALYVLGDDPTRGSLHHTALVFILSAPFSVLRELKLPCNARVDQWWDYFHVLRFHSDKNVVENLRQAWVAQYDSTTIRDVARVLDDVKPLEPIEPARLFDLLRMSEARKKELLPLFEEREFKSVTPNRIDPPADESASMEKSFVLEYTNGDQIRGRCVGADDHNKPTVIWIGGFTENEKSSLPDLFAKVLAKEDIVQFYFRNSSPLRDITLTRYEEDMREVIKYVARQPVVDECRIVVVARSVNALLAARVVAQAEFENMVAGVVLIAPVFDMIEMVDNYRVRKKGEEYAVRLETCWRHRPGYTADRWENEQNEWLEFYGQNLSLGLFADIIRYSPEHYALATTVKAIAKISQKKPVYILSNPDDPVVASPAAIEAFEKALRNGDINAHNFGIIPIKSQHDLAKQMENFFSIREEVRETNCAIRKIFDAMKIPVVSAADIPVACTADAPVAVTTEPQAHGGSKPVKQPPPRRPR